MGRIHDFRFYLSVCVNETSGAVTNNPKLLEVLNSTMFHLWTCQDSTGRGVRSSGGASSAVF